MSGILSGCELPALKLKFPFLCSNYDWTSAKVVFPTQIYGSFWTFWILNLRFSFWMLLLHTLLFGCLHTSSKTGLHLLIVLYFSMITYLSKNIMHFCIDNLHHINEKRRVNITVYEIPMVTPWSACFSLYSSESRQL